MNDAGSSSRSEATVRVGSWDRPERRRCAHLHESGVRCNGTTAAGNKFCHTHQRYEDANPMYPVKVPLLENPGAIRMVISQTVRQLAVGTIPAGNGRAMLNGCRTALDLLLYEFAVEKYRAQQQQQQASARRDPLPGLLVAAAPPVIEECAAQAADPCPAQHTDERPPESEVDPDAENDPEPEPEQTRTEPEIRFLVPRFTNLRRQWDAGLRRGEREVARHIEPQEGESLGAWDARQQGPIEAGHPRARSACCAGVRDSDPTAEAHPGPYGPHELPFDPNCPPASRPGLTDDWLPEHFEAYFRAQAPQAPESWVRDYVRTMSAIPEADRRARWRWPRHGDDPDLPPPEDCIFWTMSESEIAAWLHEQAPDMSEAELQAYAQKRIKRMEEIRSLRAHQAASAHAEEPCAEAAVG